MRFSDLMASFKQSIDTASWGDPLPRILEHHENGPSLLDEHLADRRSGDHLRLEDVGVVDLWRRVEEPVGVGHQRGGDRSVEMRLSLRESNQAPSGRVPDLRFVWSGRPDSNRRPSPWQGDALPTEPRPQWDTYLSTPTFTTRTRSDHQTSRWWGTFAVLPHGAQAPQTRAETAKSGVQQRVIDQLSSDPSTRRSLVCHCWPASTEAPRCARTSATIRWVSNRATEAG